MALTKTKPNILRQLSSTTEFISTAAVDAECLHDHLSAHPIYSSDAVHSYINHVQQLQIYESKKGCFRELVSDNRSW